MTDLLTNGKCNLQTPATAFSFLLWSTVLLCCLHNSYFVVCNFLSAQFAEGIHSTSRILLCKPRKLHKPFFKSSASLIRSFPTSGCHWPTKIFCEEFKLNFCLNFSVLFQSFSARPRSSLTSMSRKITELL